MSLPAIDDWFAVIDPNKSDHYYPGRLRFDSLSSMKLLVVHSAGFESGLEKILENEVIIGLLDYQTPSTLLNNFISSRNYGAFGVNSRYMRTRYSVVSNVLLKNVHLSNLNEECFLDVRSSSAAFSAWLAWKIFDIDFEEFYSNELNQVKFTKPISLSCTLAEGVVVRVETYLNWSSSEQERNFNFEPHTLLQIVFPKAVAYQKIQTVTEMLENLFSFLIGRRMALEQERMLTTHCVEWNDEEERIVAESVFNPVWNRDVKAPYITERIFVSDSTPVELGTLIELCLDEKNLDLSYWMNVVLAHKMHDMKVPELFFEILRCLEDIDKEINDKRRKSDITLRMRLERLFSSWENDKFRGKPDWQKIVSLRNMRAHGGLGEYTIEQVKEMMILNKFLSALLRYHILRQLGFDRDSIASGFRRAAHDLGMFVPEDFRKQI